MIISGVFESNGNMTHLEKVTPFLLYNIITNRIIYIIISSLYYIILPSRIPFICSYILYIFFKGPLEEKIYYIPDRYKTVYIGYIKLILFFFKKSYYILFWLYIYFWSYPVNILLYTYYKLQRIQYNILKYIIYIIVACDRI